MKYRIAGNFRAVQNFAFFADRSPSVKIKTNEKFFNAHAHRQGWISLPTVGTGPRMALYRYFSSATGNLPDPKGPLSKKMHTYVAPVRDVRGQGYEYGRGSIKHKRENKNHENFF